MELGIIGALFSLYSRRTYEDRRNAIIQDLTHFKERHPQISWYELDGGMALWLDIDRDSKQFAEFLKTGSILVNPEEAFRIEKKAGTHLRLGFSGYSAQENRASLQAMFRMFAK